MLKLKGTTTFCRIMGVAFRVFCLLHYRANCWLITIMAECNDCEEEWKKKEKEVTCFHCKDLFTEPKTLSCLHTFCEKCIESLANNQEGGGACLVPLCQTKLPRDIKAIPTNSCFKHEVDILRKRKAAASQETNNRKCECKDRAPAVMWCWDCINFLCEECLLQVSLIRGWSNLSHTKQ